jgi:guanylate kinase
MSGLTDGIMVILSSPSGAGKTTLVKLLSERDNFNISISHTTRKPREKEVPNRDYFFVDKNEFESLIKDEEFLEYAKVFNNLYGTTRSPVINKLNDGKNVIFDIDWQGADQIKNKRLRYKLITFFLLPPSKEVLFNRLSNRDMKDKVIVDQRMKEFERDVLHWINYDYVVINDELEKCYEKIKSLISAEINNGPKEYDKDYIREHVKKLTN